MHLGRSFVRFILSTCIALSALSAFSARATDAIPGSQAERILQLRVGGHVFDNVLISYQIGNTLFVPLGQLAQIIDLAVTTYPVDGSAKGFIFDEKKTFLLDSGQRIVSIAGHTQPLDLSRIKVLPDDIYVDSTLFADWFPFKLEADLLASQLVIYPKIPLPFQRRLEREQRLAGLGRTRQQRPHYPLMPVPYQWADVPFIDQSVGLGSQRDTSGRTSNTFNYTTYATGDLLGMESSWYLSGNQDNPTQVFRGVLGRKDPGGNLAGPLHATEYAFGGVAEPSVNLVNRPNITDPGVMVSNNPLHRSMEYTHHTFSGDLLPGWEVELYQNNVLIGYQQSNAKGQYEFADVPLLFGQNYFRLVFYGPQGQQHEETEQFNVGQSLVTPGQQYYRVVARQGDGGGRYILEYDLGLLTQLSAAASVVSIPLTDSIGVTTQHDYTKLSLYSSWSQAFSSLSLINDSQGGVAADLQVQGRLAKVNYSLSRTQMRDFISEQYPSTQAPVSSSTKLRLDSIIPPSVWTPTLPVTLSLQRDVYTSGSDYSLANAMISYQNRALALTNQFTWSRLSGFSGNTVGDLQLSSNINTASVRGDIQYQVSPSMVANAYSVTANFYNVHHYSLSAGLNYTVSQDMTTLNLSLSRDFDDYLLSASVNYGTGGTYSAGLNISFSLGRDPTNYKWTASSHSMARFGSVAARVYVDNNQDGKYDANDEWLSGVGFAVDGLRRGGLTDDKGAVMLTGLPVYWAQPVAIDTGTLTDPLLSPVKKGVDIVTRPGHVVKVDFPVITTGEADGYVKLRKGGREINVGGVDMVLLDDNGKVVQKTKTAFDGYYLFSNIPAGHYRITVAPEQLKRLGLASVRASELHLTPDRMFVSNNNFVLSVH